MSRQSHSFRPVFDFVLKNPTNDTLLPKLSPFRYDDPRAHLLKSVQLALTQFPLLNAFGILLGAVLYLPIHALLHVLFALFAFPGALAQLIVAMDVPIVLALGTYGEAAPAFGGGYGAPRRAGFVAVFLSEFVSHGMEEMEGMSIL